MVVCGAAGKGKHVRRSLRDGEVVKGAEMYLRVVAQIMAHVSR